VKPIEKEEVTASGIVLPDTVDKKQKAEGVVIAVGPGKTLENGTKAPMDVKVGDKVLFRKWGGEEVKIEKDEYKMLGSEDILAIVE